MKPTVYTIGHSNRTLADFLRLLKAHGVEQVLDVRAIPQSRHNQQFARLDLARALRARSSGYRWVPKLGGRRHATKDSPNSGWRNAAFRSDADYMATASFAQGLNIAEDVAASKPTALMCAEAVPAALSPLPDRGRADQEKVDSASHHRLGRDPDSPSDAVLARSPWHVALSAVIAARKH
jgi:uncharacterized protein (DUF488 family)